MKHLYKLILLIALIFTSLKSISQTDIIPKGLINPSFGLNGGSVYANQIATTDDGYTYTAGRFTNTDDFDLTQDTLNISSTYLYNMFIAKYDNQSHLVFAFKLSGLSGYDNITAITTDKDDNIYVAGYFAETIDFDPGAGTAEITTPNYYTYYMFFAKYDKNGNFIFVKPILSTEDINRLGEITSIKTDDSANIFIAGYGKPQSLDFDPGNRIVHPESHGGYDAFFAKYDVNGNYVFAKAVGSNDDDACRGLTLNKNKDIIITGSFVSAVNDFDPNGGKIILPFNGASDAFVGIYNPAGDYKYAFSLGGVKADNVNGVATDNDSNIIVSGTFYGNVDFAPDSNVVKKSSDSDYDYFLAKYSSLGKLIFVTTIQARTPGFSNVCIDDNNNIYFGGRYTKKILFNVTDSFISKEKSAAFIAKYTSAGVYKFSNEIEGGDLLSINSISLSNNQLYAAGNFSDTSYFTLNHTKKIITQNQNSFIAVYNTSTGNNTSANAFGTYRQFMVESAVVKLAHDKDNNTYVAGTFEGIVDFDPGIKQYILTSSQDVGSRDLFTSLTDDIFFAKYNAAGKLIFAKDIGGTAGQAPISIVVDNNRNIYLAGTFAGDMDADPGKERVILKQQHNASLYQSYFIGKYDSSGNYIFAKPIYVSGDMHAFTIDKKNDLYITGYFGAGYFDPNNDTSKISVNGDYAYFAKYNSNGNFVYLKSIGQKSELQFSYDIAVNNKGNIVICGAVRGSQVDFDPGPNTYYANSGPGFAHFIAVYTTNGDFLFESNGECLNSSSSSQSYLLKIDKSDNIICEGYLGGNIKLDSRFDSVITSSNGSLYFMKYSSTGIPLFIKTLSASNQSQQLTLESLALDNSNNIYLAGEFYGKVDFDPGPDSSFLISQTTMHSGTNAYLAKYDSSGNYEYAYNFAPIDSFFNRGVYKMDLYINKNDEIIWGLNSNGSIDFDPGPDTFYYYSPLNVYQNLNGGYSFVIVKFKQTQTVKPFTIYAISQFDKIKIYHLNKYRSYFK